MDAEHLLHRIQRRTHPQGEVLIHVVDRDREYWLEVTDVIRSQPGETPWIDGAVIETKPIVHGPRASREIFTPRPFFSPNVTYVQPDDDNPGITTIELPEDNVPTMSEIEAAEEMRLKEQASKKLIDDLACKSPEQLLDMQRTGELKAVYGIDPGQEITGVSRVEIEIKDDGRDLHDVERDDHQSRIPFAELKPREISGQFTIEGFEGAAERFQRVVEYFGSDPYESEPLKPPVQPIVGRTLYDDFTMSSPEHTADIESDPSEPHYQVAREINRSQISDLLGIEGKFVTASASFEPGTPEHKMISDLLVEGAQEEFEDNTNKENSE